MGSFGLYVYVAVTLVPAALGLVAIGMYFRRARTWLGAIWLGSAAAAFAVGVASHLNAIFVAPTAAIMLRARVLGYLGLGLAMVASISFLLVMRRLLEHPDSLVKRSPDSVVHPQV